MIWVQFYSVDHDEVDRILDAVSDSTCQFDPCLSWMVKASRTLISSWVQAMINILLQEGTFPGSFKDALFRPLLKKTIA